VAWNHTEAVENETVGAVWVKLDTAGEDSRGSVNGESQCPFSGASGWLCNVAWPYPLAQEMKMGPLLDQ